jgi:hypothetical protein
MTTFYRRHGPFTGGAVLVASLLFGASAFADDAVLSGFTLTVNAQRAAEKAARKETKKVENRLRVFPEKRADDEVRKAVADAILRDPTYGVFDSVGVGVEEGVVVLQGSVNQPWRKDDLDRRVARVPGVREIKNEIRVQPTSIHDDRLRVQLYRRIYGDILFERLPELPRSAHPHHRGERKRDPHGHGEQQGGAGRAGLDRPQHPVLQGRQPGAGGERDPEGAGAQDQRRLSRARRRR